MSHEPILIEFAGYDSQKKPILNKTITFDSKGNVIFQDFLNDGLSLEQYICVIYTAWREHKLMDFEVLIILEQIAGRRLNFSNRAEIVNCIVGSALDMWQKDEYVSCRANNIFANVKRVHGDIVTQTMAIDESDYTQCQRFGRIREMNRYIQIFTKRDLELERSRRLLDRERN